jgi:WD40 repeat protein
LLLKNKKLLSCSGDKVGIWDIQSASLLHLLGGHTGSVDAVELRDGQIISFSADGVVKIWNGESYQSQTTIRGYVIKGLLELTDGRILLRSKGPDGKSNRLTIWNLKGECEVTMVGHDGIHTNWTKSIYGAMQLDDGRILSIGERDFALRLWDPKTGQLLQTFLGHTGELKNVNFLKNGNMVSSSWDKTYRIWDIHTGECLQILHEGHLMLEFNIIELSNNRLLTLPWNKGAKVWDLNTGEQLAELGDGQLKFFGAKLLESGDLISWDYENQVMIWDMNSYQVKTLVEQGWVDTGKFPSQETLDNIRSNDARPNYERPYGYGQANFKSQSSWYAQSIQKHLSIINIESNDHARWVSDMQSIYMLKIHQNGLLSINTSKGFEFLQVYRGKKGLLLH